MVDVFCLTNMDGKPLSPAIQATVLAKYSRTALSAREILSSLSEEESDKFNDKWVVGYGHSSVAELATVPVCIEGLSIVASKVIESMPRCAYSEKSTRYQRFSSKSFVSPPGAPETMGRFVSRLYEAYDKLHDGMVRRCALLMGKDPNDPGSIDRVVKARAFDSLRYLLPAGTGTNVACVMNLRDARDLVALLKGHTNSELRLLGNEIHDAVNKICPSLMKHASPNQFRFPIRSIGPLDPDFDPDDPAWYVKIHKPHMLPPSELAQKSFESTVADLYGICWSEFCQRMSERPEHAQVPDVFKTIPISFEVMMDYGAFRDLQRHRRCEQYVEPLTSYYGYLVPDDISGSDLEPAYREAMESLNAYEDEISHDMDMAQYIIPLGYLHRSIFQMDLKELYYMVELRTKPQGHISYRRVAYEMFKLAEQKYRPMMRWCRAVDPVTIGRHD